MADGGQQALDPVDKVDEAICFMRQVDDAESENRQNGLNALKFSYGDQWPQYAVTSRGLERPQLTINELNAYIKKVCNNQRQQRPRGKASPIDSFASKKIAQIITGLGRHCEVQSDADNAYDTAFEFAARIGWGYWRLRTDYIADDSFNQDVFIDVVDNPFTVYFDNNSRLPDGSDAQKALITDLMTKAAFAKIYPGAQMVGVSDRSTGDSEPDWVTEQDIRLAEYYYIERMAKELVMLSDGRAMWSDKLPSESLMLAQGIGIKGVRDSMRDTVMWRKQTAFDILEEKTIPGRWIPIVPVYWTNTIIDSKRVRYGLVKDAIDPQRMLNFWQTMITESLALAPKPKWLIAEGQDEGHENEFKNANLSPTAVLRYKTVLGENGQLAPPPQRISPEPPPAGAIEASFMASQNLSRVLGVFDPAVRGGAQHKSDKTLNAERMQSENSNFNGYDNFTRSLKHSWRIMIGWFPTVFDVPQAKRIIGEDGRAEIVNLNEKATGQDEQGQAIEKVLNDVRVGRFDAVMETGPGYDTRRQEGANAMIELLGTPLGEKVAQTSDDLVVRQMDFQGSDQIADRMAAANPLAQIDESSEVPPQVQMQIKGLQQQLQQAGQVIQQLQVEQKYKLGLEKMKQEGATKRTLMQETGKVHAVEIDAAGEAHEREITQAQKLHDTEVYALSAQNVAEINALAKILTSKTEHGNRMREMIKEFEHNSQLQDVELAAKSQEQEPLGQGQLQ